ncbi:hypothetical protein KGO95_00470 [Patescibacteria group bacterium]|nr:hypothetical protein [Patescibacteria group bacterium]
MSSQQLDDQTVLVIGYDVDEDPDIELCAVFRALETERTAQLIKRYSRGAGEEHQLEMDNFRDLDEETKQRFEKVMPGFHKAAMQAFKFAPFDDSLPPQGELDI